jgi:hypothetical protein
LLEKRTRVPFSPKKLRDSHKNVRLFFSLFTSYIYINNDNDNNKQTTQSSVVITGVPTKAYRLPTEWIAPNTTIVNVSSFKNVDEDALLQIPGVVYVPRVGKVTVAMLERNLMRLFDQFHLNNAPPSSRSGSTALTTTTSRGAHAEQQELEPWYGHPLNLYTALTVTVLFAMQFMQQQQQK